MNYTEIKIKNHLNKKYEENKAKRIQHKREVRIENIKKQAGQVAFLVFGVFFLAIMVNGKQEVIEDVQAQEIVEVVELESEFKVNSNGLAQEVPNLASNDWKTRMDEMLVKYGRGEDVQHERWKRVAEKHGIKTPVLVCIAKADSSLGRELKSTNNFGNVGNNDRGDVVHYADAIAGIDAMGRVLNNRYLGHKQSIGSLSVGGGGDAPFYATSPENWNNNVINCLRAIYDDYSIDENFMFRIN